MNNNLDNIDRNNIFNLEIYNQDRENASSSSNSENTEIDADPEVEVDTGNVTDPGFNNYNNHSTNHTNHRNNQTNHTNNRNNIWNRSRCRQCNYINRNNHLNTSSYRPRSVEIDRDRYQYLEMYRDIERERQQERERQRDRNMLNQIYTDLLYQNNLLQSIRIDINNIWNRIRSNDDYMRSRHQPNNTANNTANNTTTNNRQSGTSNQRLNNQRININGIPYILENIHQFNIQPRTNTTTNDIFNSFMNLVDFQSNVPIIPTREQIISATREIQFGDIENPINTTCPISLETFQESDIVTQILHCGHNFNTRQLNTWFHSNVRCPMCRYDIREYSIANRSSERSPHNVPNNTPNNDYETSLETSENVNSTENIIDSSSNSLHTERRTRRTPRRVFSQTPSPVLETNLNSVANSLSSFAMDTINELFENNDSIFTENGDSRFLFDSSNNILLFETIVNNGNRFWNRNSNSTSNSSSTNNNQDPRNIV